MNLLLILFIPLIGTIIGASLVYFINDKIYVKIGNFLSTFASGVMFGASIFSLILPSIDLSYKLGKFAFIPAIIGFSIGVLFLILLDVIIEKMYIKNSVDNKKNLKEEIMLLLAVTLHNIPEGMAMGVMLVGLISNIEMISLVGSLSLSIGLAIQNIPEGTIVASSLRNAKVKKNKAFIYSSFTGIIEPISAIITIVLTKIITPFLPYFLSFAAGAMMYVVVENLIPKAYKDKHSKLSILGFSLGFCLMMGLDIALG